MTVVTDVAAGIDFAPASVEKEVWQNVRMILSTTKFSVPLDRDFGIDGTLIDLPLPVAKARLTEEIIRAVKRYEPRANIKTVDFAADIDGVLKPKIEIEVIEWAQ